MPYLLSFLSSLQTVMFASSSGKPGVLIVFWTLLIEIGHTFGVTLFLFKVLPNVQNITGLFLMNSLCILPAILKIIFSSRRGMTRLKKFTTFLLDIASIACQSTIFFVFKMSAQFDSKPFEKVAKEKDEFFMIYLVISALLISFSYWENFSEVRYSTNRATLFIQSQINELRKYNAKIYLFVTPVKIFLIFVFSYLLMPKSVQQQYKNFNVRFNFTDVSSFDQDVPRVDIFFSQTAFYVPCLVHMLSSILCYYTARIACKVLMQGLGFSLPLALSTPVTFLVLFVSSFKVQFQNIKMDHGIAGNYFYLDGFSCWCIFILSI